MMVEVFNTKMNCFVEYWSQLLGGEVVRRYSEDERRRLGSFDVLETDAELGLDTARDDGLNDLESVGVSSGEHTNKC